MSNTRTRRRRHIHFVVAVATLATLAVSQPVPVQSATPSLGFGVDMDFLQRAGNPRLPVAYGTFWVGAWTMRHGWSHAEGQLRAARKNGVTPVVSWWYWGDDISPRCVEQGCRDQRHDLHKDRATWNRMADELSKTIERTMGRRETIVVLETEFNKGGIETYEAFDRYLVEQVEILRRRGNVKVVIGFGNWGHDHWHRFARAVAAADYVGTQLLRSSIHDERTYSDAVGALVRGARFAQARFDKPSFIVDLGFSSYPSWSYEARQAQVTRELFARLPELKAAGVRGILYRMMADNPSFDTSNYHGVAERHWGFLRADGSEKPAYQAFTAGLRREARAGE